MVNLVSTASWPMNDNFTHALVAMRLLSPHAFVYMRNKQKIERRK